MNREIKFRAWLWKHLKVVDVIRIDFETQEITYQEIDFEYDDVIREKTALFKDISLLQYTGLKDKNGAEIYEGNIVEYYGRSAVVKIGFPHDDKLYPYGVCIEYIKYNLKEVEYLYKFNLEDIEVIGNIYENRDLLTA